MDGNNFIGYEYRMLSVREQLAPVYSDGYANFGWTLENSTAPQTVGDKVSLRFKRERKIRNKAELTRLQRQFDAYCEEIMTLEHSKTQKATIAALATGIVGSAFLTGSLFAITAAVPNGLLCVVLGAPGLIGWVLPYFLYQHLCAKKTEAVNPLIEKKYDEIYDVCEKGNSLLGK